MRLRFSGILCMADKQAITLADGQPRCHTEIPQAPRTQTRLLAKRNTPKNGRQINQLQAPSFFSLFPCLSEHIALLDPIGRASDAWPTFTRAAAPRSRGGITRLSDIRVLIRRRALRFMACVVPMDRGQRRWHQHTSGGILPCAMNGRGAFDS